MLGLAALLDESIANAARFIIRRFAGRKIGITPSSAVDYSVHVHHARVASLEDIAQVVEQQLRASNERSA